MRLILTCAAIALTAAAVASLPAEAAKRANAQTWQRPAPAKDCTRVNARFGYYGNPWCSPAEQQAWDRYEARRFSR